MAVNKMTATIRKAIRQDPRTLYRLSIDAGLPYQTVHRFANGQREDLVMKTAWRLCEALHLELRRKGGK